MINNIALKCIQGLLVVVQLVGLIGRVYYLIYTFLLLENMDQESYYSQTDLIILLVIFIFSIICHIIGIFATIKKRVIFITIFTASMFIEIIIYFDEGLILTATWSVITVVLALTLVAMIHQNNLRTDETQQTSDVRTHSYQDTSPPNYYSVAYQHSKQMPPRYQSVDLIPVQAYSYPDQMQRY